MRKISAFFELFFGSFFSTRVKVQAQTLPMSSKNPRPRNFRKCIFLQLKCNVIRKLAVI